ncbi:MAG: NAD(P)H-hydrate dehydratase [Zavarzinella sp.]
MITEIFTLPALPPRPEDGHKGNFGKVLVVAGSLGMSGAACLTATAALRCGAGLVQVAVPEQILPIVASFNPCYTTIPLPQDEQGRISLDAIETVMQFANSATTIVLGPGIGRSTALEQFVLRCYQEISIPMVLDADGLNSLVHVSTEQLTKRTAPAVWTPHPGEFRRLTQHIVPQEVTSRIAQANWYAQQVEQTIVLKGSGTVVSNGKACYVNRTGNPGMATGGSGDVLAGMIAGLLAIGLDDFAAARLGVWLHGTAGDFAADELGQNSLIASDLLNYLPRAFKKYSEG